MQQTVIVALILFVIIFFAITGSIRKLKSEPSSFYPFDLLIPKSKHWSIIVFIIINIIFIAIFYIGVKMDVSLLPA